MIKSNIWRFLNSHTETAQYNMAVDEALLLCYKEGDMPILRLYGWENALSIGRYSNLWTSLDRQTVEEQNIACVRRISGGGILHHGGDLSYTLIIPRDRLKGTGVKESYHHLCAFLILLYKKMGLTANFSCDLQLEEIRSDICLAGREAYDIVIQEKKMGGNAQRYTRHALFQHGSIPMRINDRFVESLFLVDAGIDKMATLEQFGISISYEELAQLVREAFCETFDVTLVADSLSEGEEHHSKLLQAEKYSQTSWNYNE